MLNPHVWFFCVSYVRRLQLPLQTNFSFYILCVIASVSLLVSKSTHIRMDGGERFYLWTVYMNFNFMQFSSVNESHMCVMHVRDMWYQNLAWNGNNVDFRDNRTRNRVMWRYFSWWSHFLFECMAREF